MALLLTAMLMVYDNEYVGEMDNWAATANRMLARGLLTAQDARTLRLLESLRRADCQHRPPLRQHLAHSEQRRLDPVTHLRHAAHALRPDCGELVERDFAARPLQPTAATLPEWDQARTLAIAFWQGAAHDVRVSEDFRAIAGAKSKSYWPLAHTLPGQAAIKNRVN